MVDPEGTRLKVSTGPAAPSTRGVAPSPVALPDGRHALHGLAQPGRHGRAQGPAGVLARLGGPTAFAHVLPAPGQRAACLQALADAFGSSLAADEPRRAWHGEALAWRWCGPDRWLASAPAGSGFEARLEGLLGDRAAIIDQGSGLYALQLSGADVRRALAKGLGLDLHPRIFLVGETALTLLAHQHVQLTRTGEDDFELVAPRSTASDLWDWLLASAAEFGLELQD